LNFFELLGFFIFLIFSSEPAPKVDEDEEILDLVELYEKDDVFQQKDMDRERTWCYYNGVKTSWYYREEKRIDVAGDNGMWGRREGDGGGRRKGMDRERTWCYYNGVKTSWYYMERERGGMGKTVFQQKDMNRERTWCYYNGVKTSWYYREEKRIDVAGDNGMWGREGGRRWRY
jgi:hypothetical protein